jgi:ribosomal protein L33
MDRNMPGYDFFAVTIVVDCPNCKLAVSVQNMEVNKICPHCNKPFECDWKKNGRFVTALVDQLERAVEIKKSGSTDTVLSVSVEMQSELPCETCHAPLQLSDGDIGIVSCTACNGPNYLKKTEQISGIDFIANGYYPDEKGSSQADFSISCISCGASVPIKGNNRTVTCGFCSRDTMISDAIWQKIHPELLIKPFYLVIKDLEGLAKTAMSTTDIQLMGFLADHFYSGIRISLAQNSFLPESIARLLMKDRNGAVANRLRKNSSFKNWFKVEDIFADKKEAHEYELEFPVETNPDLTEVEMMEFARQRMPRRLVALVYNPSITNEVMKQIIRQKIGPALVALAKRLDLEPEILRLLVNCDEGEVNKMVAHNHSLPLQSVQRLSISNDIDVLEGLMLNTNIPADIKLKVKQRLDLLK